MKSPIQGVPSPYNDSLLFQFILAEFLQAHTEVTALETLLQQQLNSESNQDLQVHRLKLLHKIRMLAGPLLCSEASGYWLEEIGTLTRFRNYVHLFQQDSCHKPLLAFKKQAHKSWLLSISLRDISDNAQCFKLFGKTLTKVRNAINMVQKQIVKLIPQFSDDENVIFFILKHHELFDKVFGISFTLNQLKKMHSGLQQASRFLVKSYSNRNFDKLATLISQKISTLEKAL